LDSSDGEGSDYQVGQLPVVIFVGVGLNAE
jgi:hypothetical protein